MRRVLWLLLGLSLAGAAAWAQSYVRGRVGVEDIHHGHGTFNRVVAGDTTVLSKWEPVNALFFGVDNTGATDCSDSLQAAIDSVSSWGGTLLLPAGDYLVGSTIIITQETAWKRVRITGYGATIEGAPALNAPYVQIGDGDDRSYGVTIEGLNIEPQNRALDWDASTVCLRLLNANYCQVRDVSVYGTQIGFKLEADSTYGTAYNYLEPRRIANCKFGFYYTWDAGGWVNENHVRNGGLLYASTLADSNLTGFAAVYIKGNDVDITNVSNNNSWTSVSFECNSAITSKPGALNIEGRFHSFVDCRYEGFDDPYILIRPGTRSGSSESYGNTFFGGHEQGWGEAAADTSLARGQWYGSKAPLLDARHVNVRAFDLAADGSTDDTEKIQSAIDMAASLNGVVYFPPGVYAVDSLVVDDPGMTLYGDRAGMTDDGEITVLKSTSGASNPILTINVADGEKGTVIKGIKFDVNSEAGVSAALSYGQNQTNWNALEDLYFENATVAIFADSNFGSLQATHIYTEATCDTALSLGEGTARDISFDQCRFMAEDLVAVIGSDDASGTTTSANITFSQCDLTLTGSGSAGTELMEIRNVHNLVIRDSWIEAGSTLPSTIDGIIVLGTGSAEPRNVIVSGCRIQGNSKAEFGVTLVDALRPHVTENHYVSLDSQLVKVTDTASFGTVSWNSPGSTVSRDDGLLVISGSTTLTDAHFKVRGLTLVAVDTLTNVELGDVYMDAGDSIVKVWNGSDWDNLSDGP